MPAPVHRAPEIGDAADDAGRRFVVHDDDRFQLARGVVLQALLEGFGRRAAAPRARHVFDVQAEPFRDLPPRDVREPAGFENQNAIARRERVHERRFGGAGAGCGEHDDGPARAENRLQPARAPRGQGRRTRGRGDRSSACAISLSTRSGTFVGPGICRKCRPVCVI